MSWSSRINQVERWFGLLTDQLIRRGVHKSVVAKYIARISDAGH